MNRKPLKATGNLNNSAVQVSAEIIKEEADYVNVAVATVDKMAVTSDQKFLSFTPSFPAVAVCWVILSVIMALRIYFTSVISEHNAKLTAENQNLTSQNNQLENNITELIHIMETKCNELNISRAQWSIDAYCPKPQNQNRQCKACQDGWLPSQSSCYEINNPDVSDQKTWEEARENCRGKISDLVVIADQTEKTFISNNSWGTSGTTGYWIGLRAEDGKWKWVDGSDLTENSWIQQPATNGQCVISVQTEGWKSVSCGARNRWICKKKALSL